MVTEQRSLDSKINHWNVAPIVEDAEEKSSNAERPPTEFSNALFNENSDRSDDANDQEEWRGLLKRKK